MSAVPGRWGILAHERRGRHGLRGRLAEVVVAAVVVGRPDGADHDAAPARLAAERLLDRVRCHRVETKSRHASRSTRKCRRGCAAAGEVPAEREPLDGAARLQVEGPDDGLLATRQPALGHRGREGPPAGLAVLVEQAPGCRSCRSPRPPRVRRHEEVAGDAHRRVDRGVVDRGQPRQVGGREPERGERPVRVPDRDREPFARRRRARGVTRTACRDSDHAGLLEVAPGRRLRRPPQQVDQVRAPGVAVPLARRQGRCARSLITTERRSVLAGRRRPPGCSSAAAPGCHGGLRRRMFRHRGRPEPR